MEDGYSSVLGRMCSVAATDVLLTANKFQQPVKRFLLSPVFGKNSPFTIGGRANSQQNPSSFYNTLLPGYTRTIGTDT